MKLPLFRQTDTVEKMQLIIALCGISGNIFLSVIKLLSGIIAHSQAVISDSVHSLADVLSDVIIIIGIKLENKKPDKRHPEGYKKYASGCAMLISLFLFYTGLLLCVETIQRSGIIISNEKAAIQSLPFISEIISLLVKELLFKFTAFYARKLKSDILLADAWHHRSDALTSLCAIVGVLGAFFGFRQLDTIAGILICGFIIISAVKIFRNALK